MLIKKNNKKSQEYDITELRIKIDQINEKLISGLKDRSRYSLNKNTFKEEFFSGLTWFEYRLKKEQDIDSEFGRFVYYDQQPLIFSKKHLARSKLKNLSVKGSKPVEIDLSKRIINLYKKTLTSLCENKENVTSYGETTKLDVENILTINERTVAIGQQVAAYKISTDLDLKKLKNAKEIRKRLIKPAREKEVIKKMVNLAKKYGIKNIKIIKSFSKELIKITLDAEVYFIMHLKK